MTNQSTHQHNTDTQPNDDSKTVLATEALKALALGTTGYILINIWAYVLFNAANLITGTRTPMHLIYAQFTGTLLAGITLLLGYRRYADGELTKPRLIQHADIRTPTLFEVFITVLTGTALFIMSIGITLLTQQAGVNTNAHSLLSYVYNGNTPPETLLIFAACSLVFIAPGEELIYRNIVQKHLYAYTTRWWSVVTASVLFTVIHAPTYIGGVIVNGQPLITGIAALAPILPVSIVIGYVYARTKNLTVPILTHGLYNAIVFIQTYYVITG